jgi:drug/metabolite transporter (DMT)-like permease
MTAILLPGHGRAGHGAGRDRRDLAGSKRADGAGARADLARPAGDPPPRRRAPPAPVLLALVAALLFGLFLVGVDQGGLTAGGSVLWVALGVQLGALPTTFAGALGSLGRRDLGVRDRALLAPVGVLTVLNLCGDGFLAYAVTRGDLAVVSVLASLAPVVTALLARALTAERPSGPQAAGATLALLGTLVVSAAHAAA